MNVTAIHYSQLIKRVNNTILASFYSRFPLKSTNCRFGYFKKFQENKWSRSALQEISLERLWSSQRKHFFDCITHTFVGIRDVGLKKGYGVKIPWWRDNLPSSASWRRDSFRVHGETRNYNIESRKSHFLWKLYSFTELISKDRALAQWPRNTPLVATKKQWYKQTNKQTNKTKQNKAKILLLLLLFRVHLLSSVSPWVLRSPVGWDDARRYKLSRLICCGHPNYQSKKIVLIFGEVIQDICERINSSLIGSWCCESKPCQICISYRPFIEASVCTAFRNWKKPVLW